MSSVSKIGDSIVFSDNHYNSFPNIVKLAGGRLISVFRMADDSQKKYGKVTHVDPSSKIVSISSDDNGKTWDSDYKVIWDDDQGDQDPCLNLMKDGTLILTFFRWKIVPLSEKETLGTPDDIKYFSRDVFDKWAAICSGSMCLRSRDNGETWEGPWPIETDKYVHGVGLRGNIVELDDGKLLVPLYGVKSHGELCRSFLMESSDVGETWNYVSDIAADPDKNFLEPFILKTEGGKLAAFLRTQSDYRGKQFDETYLNLHMSYSDDFGKTWSAPEEKDLFCPNPVHALRLPKSGDVLLTYGFRREPYGMRAVITDPECNNICAKNEIILREDSNALDLGYSSAVITDSNEILVLYYYTGKNGSRNIESTSLKEE